MCEIKSNISSRRILAELLMFIAVCQNNDILSNTKYYLVAYFDNFVDFYQYFIDIIIN